MRPGRGAVATASEIISAMHEAAPAGQGTLDRDTLGELRGLTQALIAAKPEAEEEHKRFLTLQDRRLEVPEAGLDGWLGGATVLVSGGTGCIGSVLMEQVARRGPARLVSVSRGATGGWPRQPAAEYRQADIRDKAALAAVFAEVRPDIVFHLAAQRDPGLAEHEVHRTVTTNVLGTAAVIEAAEASGVSQVVTASTGKALRPYSPEVYTASKRAAEWLLSGAARRSQARYSAARFTHVVDNSLIYARLLGWCHDGIATLHADDISFYAQSALESAQLLLLAGLKAAAGDQHQDGDLAERRQPALNVHAITDLGWPFSLLDLALGVLADAGSHTPIYFSGYAPGYESSPFPGLYDPRTAGEVSPLVNAFEADLVEQADGRVADEFTATFTSCAQSAEPILALQAACQATEPEGIRAALDTLSWQILDETLGTARREALTRIAGLTGPFEDQMGPAYRRILAAIRKHAQPA
jgi:hypothetical protein